MTRPALGQRIDNGKPVYIDVDRLVPTRLLLQATSGNGKSWALRRMLEATYGMVQQIIIDPDGEFATLREKYDYVYAAAKGGDCLADVRTAELLARKVMELGCSTIVDIYELQRHERPLFVKKFLNALINLPKELWHECIVVLDEADIFAPEGGKGQAESRNAVVDLACRGRKRGLCAWVATQRSAKLSKDVTAELKNRIIGGATIKEDRKRNAEELGIVGREEVDKFASLEPGEFFVQGPALSMELTLVKVGPVQTSHPQIGKKLKKAPAPSERVRKVLAQLADLPKEAEEEAKTVAELRTEVQKLKRELRQQSTAPDKATDGKSYDKGYEDGMGKGRLLLRAELQKELQTTKNKLAMFGRRLRGFWDDSDARRTLLDTLSEATEALDKAASTPKGTLTPETIKRALADAPKVVREVQQQLASSSQLPGRIRAASATSEGLDGPQQRILDAIAWMESIGVAEPVNGAVAVLAGYSSARNGAYMNPRGKLVSMNLVCYPRANRIAMTDEGRRRANRPDEAITTEELHRRILERLDGPQKRILQPLLERYPEAVDNLTLAQAAGYSSERNGAYMNPRGALATKELITYPTRGSVRAADFLFLENR